MSTTKPISHESIALRAHKIWEEAGRREGHALEQWLQAERDVRELEREISDRVGRRGKSGAPRAGSKQIPEAVPHSADYTHPGISTDALHHHRNEK